MFSHDEYAALAGGAGLLDRGRRGRIRLAGDDRRAYLHGQLTNDILALSRGDGCYAALLTPQGRMISDMRVSELGDELLLDLPAETAHAVRARLDELVFTEDVQVEDASGSLAQVGVYGPRAADVLAGVLSWPAAGPEEADSADAPAGKRERLHRMQLNANSSWSFGGRSAIAVSSDDYGVPGFELFVPVDQSRTGAGTAVPPAELLAALRREGALDVSTDTAHVCRVEAGRPEFGLDMDEHTIPLEAGIEDRAINMTKGCYVGQEVIVRVLHRGHGRVAKRLVGFVGEADGGELARGQRLFAAGDASRDIGSVTSAATSPRLGRPIGLGYVHRDFTEPGTTIHAVRRNGEPQGPLTIVTLPFIA